MPDDDPNDQDYNCCVSILPFFATRNLPDQLAHNCITGSRDYTGNGKARNRAASAGARIDSHRVKKYPNQNGKLCLRLPSSRAVPTV